MFLPICAETRIQLRYYRPPRYRTDNLYNIQNYFAYLFILKRLFITDLKSKLCGS